MLVFPAFDKNYRTRKRSLFSCASCKAKRVKCDNYADYQLYGCDNCQRFGLKCLLVDSPDIPRTLPTPSPMPPKRKVRAVAPPPQTGLMLAPIVTSSSSRSTSLPTVTTATTTPNTTDLVPPVDVKKLFPDTAPPEVTAEYLRKQHNFICLGRAHDCVSLWLTLEVPPRSSEVRKLPYEQYKMLHDMNAFTLLLETHTLSSVDICNLLELYMLKVNLVWPLLPAEEFWVHLGRDEVPSIITYAMVLVIARDPMAEPILVPILGWEGYHQKLEKFMVNIENKTRQLLMAMPYLCFDFRFCKMVVMTMFLFHFGPHRFGNEQMLSDLSSAISIAVGMEIHKKNTIVNVAAVKREYVTNLWWVLYVSDRLNGLINARSLFIRLDDFNLDLPYANLNLLKLVQLARLVENMMLAVFRPFDNNNVVLQINKMEIRYKMFDLDEFQKMEFAYCDREQYSTHSPYNCQFATILDLRNSLATYTAQHLHFISRVLQNHVVAIAQKVRYDDCHIPNLIPELYVFKACHNIIFYNHKMPREIHLHLPITVFTLFYALCYLLLRRTYAKFLSPQDAADIGLEYELEEDSTFAWNSQMKILRCTYAGKWWFIEEYCRLAHAYNELYLLQSTDLVPTAFLAYDMSHFSYNMVFIALESDLFKLREAQLDETGTLHLETWVGKIEKLN